MAVISLQQPRVLWQRRRTRRLIIESGAAVLVALVVLYLLWRASRLQLGFDFLEGRAGFAISHQWLTDYTGSSDRAAAYVTGIWNTIRLVATGLALATLVGVVVGVSRLSKNWLVSRLAALYVEIFRNTPLLVQIIFWYTAVLLQLPPLSRGFEFAEVVFLSNRALAVPWAYPREGFWLWALLLLVALVAAWAVRRWRIRYEERTGVPGYPNSSAIALFLLLAGGTFLLAGAPLDLEIPEPGGGGEGEGLAQLVGGMQVTQEFAALLLALVIYTGAFIAEIVRGSIQALPRGQTEAAMALGLGGYQRLTLVILPQALRIMIPPLTNQYLNLTKNSSLAVAIAYPDLVFVARTLQNNIGHAVPIFLMVMATYLLMSFVISAFMNALNRRVQLVGR